jgi:hypothetical protein
MILASRAEFSVALHKMNLHMVIFDQKKTTKKLTIQEESQEFHVEQLSNVNCSSAKPMTITDYHVYKTGLRVSLFKTGAQWTLSVLDLSCCYCAILSSTGFGIDAKSLPGR